MHDGRIIAEFTHQAESFNRSEVARSGQMLDDLVALATPGQDERWLEVACGPGLVSRHLAPHVLEVHGVDMTPAMIAVARREAAAAGHDNATFSVGDATALDLPSAGFDGAIARFAIHHIPAPGRLFGELARVVRPGGRIILADHVADDDADAAAWSQEIERLRDPSHWACLPISRLRALGGAADLRLEREEVVPLALDYEDWLQRGSGGPEARALIEDQLAQRPEPTRCFSVIESHGRRVLQLRLWLSRWARAE
jgi:SAM-dependent methyltransferase